MLTLLHLLLGGFEQGSISTRSSVSPLRKLQAMPRPHTAPSAMQTDPDANPSDEQGRKRRLSVTTIRSTMATTSDNAFAAGEESIGRMYTLG